MDMRSFRPGDRLTFDYVNHRGVRETRDVIFKGLDYGHNEWYPTACWFMRCRDLVRDADRSFAIGMIDADTIEVKH